MTRVLVAVTLPRHPTTGNCFRSPSDAAALAVALLPGTDVEIAHASERDCRDELRIYAGFDVSRLTWIRSPDPASALVRRAAETGADAVLTGTRAAMGLGTGLLPYIIARDLRWPVLAGILRATPCSDGWRCETALPHGAREVWQTDGPFVGTVASSAGSPGIPRFAATRQAEIALVQEGGPEPIRPVLADAPRRAVALSAPVSPDHAVRLRAVLSGPPSNGTGRTIAGSPDELADAFLKEVRSCGLLRRR